MAHISLENVDLTFRLKSQKRIKDYLIPPKKKADCFLIENEVKALKNINLSLKEGDRLGIIGHNGAGKSSLLKTLAQIYPVTSGKVQVSGKVACLFELATGFEMEATGWDNIYLRGLMLGESPESIKSKMDEIADFSELGKFLNMPVKFYSSGMFVRLAFSISTAIEPEILLLDEVVAAGDAAFINKAQKRMQELVNKVRILIFVSHDMNSIMNVCNKCMWLYRGEMKDLGVPERIIQLYLQSVTNQVSIS